MTPQRYCCTLQQSKRLRELGVDAPAIWSHITCNGEYQSTFLTESISLGTAEHDSYPAYTDGELFNLIPHSQGDSLLCLLPPNDGNEYLWTCLYLPLGVSILDHSEPDYCDAKELAECLASFLIYLLEYSLITPSQVNNQLK